MAKCEKCGNDYDKAIEVKMAGKTHVFDSFECAINTLAPKCDKCGNQIIGHGVEARQKMFCCVHCAQQAGEKQLKDRV